ncbi:MAG: low molecular weight protein-tyrosine-phosphatase [Wenzhouxiangella sp.]|jgi:protein-tyrosine phosphatase|nr:low molecular weight protein-tyrosine-phosphatase [Wenzhouxiangella sp.]
MTRILFVCLGNICRSPTAEAVFDHKLREAGLSLELDSAGTGDWHIGHPPDPRSQAFARSWGVDMSGQRARQVCHEDFLKFDRIYAMDRANLAELERRAPAEASASLALVMDLAPDYGLDEVPDPYYGGDEGFKRVIDMLEAAADCLIAELTSSLR